MREEKVGITRHDLHVLGGDAVGLAHHLVLVRADDHLAVILQAFPAMVNRLCEPGQVVTDAIETANTIAATSRCARPSARSHHGLGLSLATACYSRSKPTTG